jgi:hypothetical protein
MSATLFQTHTTEIKKMRRNKLFWGLTTCALFAVIVFYSVHAVASIFTSVPGSSCMPYTEGGPSYFRSFTQMINTSSVAEDFVCPLTRANASSVGKVLMTLQYTRATTTSSNPLYCSAYVADSFGNIVAGAGSVAITTAQTSTFPFAALTPVGSGVDIILCQLGPNDSIRAIDTTEM